MSVDQPWFVETVAAHGAAEDVGEQPLHVFGTVRPVEGDLVVRHLGRKLALQAVGVDEEASVLLLQLLHPLRSGRMTFGIGGFLRLLQGRGLVLDDGVEYWNSHDVSKELSNQSRFANADCKTKTMGSACVRMNIN